MSDAPMLYRELPPTARLQDVVASFWEFRATERLNPGHKHSIPLDGSVSIVYAVTQRGPGVIFVGPRLESLQVPVFPLDRFWGVRFLPGASNAAIGVEGAKWRDRYGLLHAEAPSLAAMVAKAFSEATNLEEAVPRFEEAIDPGKACPIARAGVYQIAQSKGLVKIADIPGQIGISERQFLRRFRLEVGLTPKQFARICRFRAAAIDALRDKESSWGEIAARRGFADQAHLNHEFNLLFGIAPREFESRFLAEIEHGVLV